MGIATSEVRARAIAAYESGNGTQAEIAKMAEAVRAVQPNVVA